MPFVHLRYKVANTKEGLYIEKTPLPQIRPIELDNLDKMFRDIIQKVDWKIISPQAKWARITDNLAPRLRRNKGGGSLTQVAQQLDISKQEVGYWLDNRLERTFRLNDGRDVKLHPDSESLIRFDLRKPIYFYGETPCAIITLLER
jgi:hypothetical protein